MATQILLILRHFIFSSLSLSLSQEEADFRLALQMQEEFDSEMARAISDSSTTAPSSSKRYYSKQNNVTISQHGKQTCIFITKQ